MKKNTIEPMGAVIFFGKKQPVIWERETSKYVFNIKRLIQGEDGWNVKQRYYEDKMDKEEIFEYRQ